MVAPQFTISVMFGGEKPCLLPGWMKNSPYYNVTARDSNLGTKVPRSYLLVHIGGSDLSSLFLLCVRVFLKKWGYDVW